MIEKLFNRIYLPDDYSEKYYPLIFNNETLNIPLFESKKEQINDDFITLLISCGIKNVKVVPNANSVSEEQILDITNEFLFNNIKFIGDFKKSTDVFIQEKLYDTEIIDNKLKTELSKFGKNIFLVLNNNPNLVLIRNDKTNLTGMTILDSSKVVLGVY